MMIVGTSDPGCPPLFPYHVEMTVGALFFVLEKYPLDASLSYGGLDMTLRGDILFNGVEIQSLASLFQGCLPHLIPMTTPYRMMAFAGLTLKETQKGIE